MSRRMEEREREEVDKEREEEYEKKNEKDDRQLNQTFLLLLLANT
jgi:hypothetical protein